MRALRMTVAMAALCGSVTAWAAEDAPLLPPPTPQAVEVPGPELTVESSPGTGDGTAWTTRRKGRKVSAQLGVSPAIGVPLVLTAPMVAFDFGWVELSAGALFITTVTGSGTTPSLVLPRLEVSALQNLGVTLSESASVSSALLFGRVGVLVEGWPGTLAGVGASLDPIALRVSWRHGPDLTLRGRLESAFLFVLNAPPGTWDFGVYLAPGLSLEVALPLS